MELSFAQHLKQPGAARRRAGLACMVRSTCLVAGASFSDYLEASDVLCELSFAFLTAVAAAFAHRRAWMLQVAGVDESAPIPPATRCDRLLRLVQQPPPAAQDAAAEEEARAAAWAATAAAATQHMMAAVPPPPPLEEGPAWPELAPPPPAGALGGGLGGPHATLLVF